MVNGFIMFACVRILSVLVAYDHIVIKIFYVVKDIHQGMYLLK